MSTPSIKTLAKQIAWLSLPLAGVHLGQVCLGLVDSMFLGRVGADELAAVSLGNGVFFAVTTLGMGCVLGAEPVISQAVGAGDHGRARLGLFIATLVSVIATLPVVLLTLGALEVLTWVDLDPHVVDLTCEYVHARLFGVLGFFLSLAFKAYLQAYEVNSPAVIAIVLANLINVPLDAFLIFGDKALLFVGLGAVGFEGWSVLGSGIATTIASWFRALFLLPFLFRVGVRERVPVVSEVRKELLRVFRVGLPVGLQLFWEVSMFALVSVLMGTLGNAELAAHQVALQLASVPFNVTIGVGTATTVVVGQQIGRAGDVPDRGALRAGVAGIGIGVLVMSISATLFLLIPDRLVWLFTDEAEVVAVAVVLVQIASAFALFDGAQAVAAGALRGAGDTVWAFVSHLVASWLIGLPMAALLGFYFALGPVGLWLGLTAGLATAGIVLTTRFVREATRGYRAL